MLTKKDKEIIENGTFMQQTGALIEHFDDDTWIREAHALLRKVMKKHKKKDDEYVEPKDGETVHIYKGDSLCILPETDHLDLGCCTCGAFHNIDIKHDRDNVLLIFN